MTKGNLRYLNKYLLFGETENVLIVASITGLGKSIWINLTNNQSAQCKQRTKK